MSWYWKSRVFLFCKAEDKGRPEPAITIPFPVNKFPIMLAPKVPNNILKNPPFCSFVSFLIVLGTPFSKIFESSSAWIIFIISFLHLKLWKSYFQTPIFFYVFPHSADEAAAVNPKGIKTLLVNDLITFFINGNPVFNNGPSNLPRNSPDWIILHFSFRKF